MNESQSPPLSSSTANMPSVSAPTSASRRTGAVTACDQCYRCKVRCSGTQDKCDRCVQNSSICTYSLGRPLGKPPKSGTRAKALSSTRPRSSVDDGPGGNPELPESPKSSPETGRRKRQRRDTPPVRSCSVDPLLLLPCSARTRIPRSPRSLLPL